MRLSTEETVSRYKDRLFTIAFNICQNPADADDAVQDAFIKYYSLNKEFEDETHIKAWLIRVTINRSKDITSSFWRKHSITEKFDNGVCYVKLIHGQDELFLTVKYNDGYASIPRSYISEESLD